MTDKTPGGKVINGTPLDHIRVVIPFSSDTPHNSVGPLSVSKETQDEMTKLLASTGQPEVWAHLDFNGMHLATTVAHGEGAAIEERLRSMGALADKEDHRPSGLHNTGATRFVPKDVNIERYGVTGRESWVRVVEGGAGSGDRGHAGRPGERGGSAAGDFHITVVPSEVHIDDGKGYTISVPGDHLTFFGVKDAKMGAVLLDEVQQVSKKFGVPVPDVFMTGYVESQQEGNNGMTAQNPITRQNVMVIDPRDFDQALLQSQGKLDSLHTAKAAWPPVMPAPTTTEEYGRMVVDHEMGHVLHNRFSNLETQQMQKVTLDVRDRWDTTRLRPYALYSPEEMFAEAFAMKVNGYEKYVPHELAKFIDSKVKKYGKDLREAWSSEMVRRPWFICDSRIGPPTYKLEKVRVVEGGAGSGDHGHAGRPGERGGSASTDALGIKFHTKAAEKFTIHGGDVSVKVIPTPSSSTDKIAAAVSQEIQHLKEAYDIPLPAHVFVGSAITSDGQNFDERAGADGVTMKSKEGLVLGIQPENAVRSSVPGGNDFWPQSLPYPDTVEEAVRFTTAHEMGHVLMYSMPNQWQHQMNQVTEDVHRRGEWDTDQLADYGNSDAAEMFAEAFANYSYGNEKYLPPRLRSFISETLAQKVWKHTVPGSMV